MPRLLALLVVCGLVSATTLTAEATPRKKTRTEYIVTEVHPGTGGRISTARFPTRAAALQHHDILKTGHWVQWKYVGINEPMRYQRFKTAGLAQAFIDNDGPSRSGRLGIALLTGDTKILPAKVSFTQVEVPSGAAATAAEMVVATRAK
jgi:hypothetical protein